MPNTWEACRDAGMTATEAARALGKDESSARGYARRHGFRFAPGKRGPTKGDPAFIERARAAMRARWADPKRNRLMLLTDEERAEHRRLRRIYGYKSAEALRMIGRGELVQS